MSEAEAALGTVNAKALVTAIADIEAQENGSDLLGYMSDTANFNADDTLTIFFGTECAATFTVAARRFQRDHEERVIWSSVSRLKLIAIEGCNGS